MTDTSLQQNSTELKLETTRRLAELGFESSPMGTAITDQNGLLLAANAKARELLEVSQDDLHAVNLIQIYYELTGRVNIIQDLLEERTIRDKLRLVNADGTISWIGTTISPTTEDGQPNFIFHFQDITIENAAIEQLLASEERMTSYFEGMPIPSAIVELDGRIISTNNALANLLGYDSAIEIGGRLNGFEFLKDPDEQVWQDRIELALQGQTGVLDPIETILVGRDGGDIPVMIFTNIVPWDQGFAGQMVAIDLRPFKEIELQQAQIIASEKVSQIRDMIIKIISHELRTPLSVVNTRTYLTRRHGPQQWEKVLENMRVIEAEVARTSKIIDSILNLGKLTGIEQSDLNVSSFSILHNLKDKIEGMQSVAEKNGQTLTFIDSTTPTIEYRGDESLIWQALDIVLENAFVYTPEGGLIEVQATVQDQQLVISVHDNGCGILPEEKELIFELFHRGSSHTSHSVPGIGVGLSIARDIMRLHDGDIEIISEGVPGEGTTVNLILPLDTQEG